MIKIIVPDLTTSLIHFSLKLKVGKMYIFELGSERVNIHVSRKLASQKREMKTNKQTTTKQAPYQLAAGPWETPTQDRTAACEFARVRVGRGRAS